MDTLTATTEKEKKPKKAKVKDPNRLTKRQKVLMSHLNEGGFAMMKKCMGSDSPRFQIMDLTLNPISFVAMPTITSLVKRKFIYKATDGRYHSIKYYQDAESKPVPATDDSIQQTEFFSKGKGRGRNSFGRPDTNGDTG